MNPAPPRTSLAIVGHGLCTPLGLDASVTCAEMAAGTTAFRETEVHDRAGEPVRAARLPLIPPACSRSERMALMARTALWDVFARTQTKHWSTNMPVVLALPDPADGGAPMDVESLANAIAGIVREVAPKPSRATGVRRTAPTVIARGRAAFFLALAQADRLLAHGDVDAVMIGAVDSLCDKESLRSLAGANRVLSAANPDGLIPGEGAGFVILGRPRSREMRGRLLAHATAEGAGVGAPPASTGQALTDVFVRLGSLAPMRAARVLSAQPGERRWSRELAVAMLRAPRGLPEPFTITRVTESMGDPTAAAALVLTVAALVVPLDPSLGPSLVYGSSDHGLTGGLLVTTA